MTAPANKIISVQQAASLVSDGDQVAIGGHTQRRHPMALIYELVRQGKKDLSLVGWNNGIDMDLLIGAGCVREVQTSYVGMGKHGLALNHRRAAQRGELKIFEESENTALERFRAGAMGISFIPSNGPLGSGLMQFERETREITCPFTGKKMAALRAAQPDIALIHMHRGDAKGNLQLDSDIVMENIADVFIARSARKVVASVEEIVSTEEIMNDATNTVVPNFFVDAVVEVKWGAHPCCCDTRYDYDFDFLDKYYAATKEESSFEAFLQEYVHSVEDFDAYLKKAEWPTAQQVG
ncbi:MAG: CoA transferase subunit A [Planctomycetes bacterium]|nr:CoA transferase subunit A [Planctomycetota bacterium]